MKIDHIALYCRDLEEMRTFFEKYFQGRSNNLYHNPRTNFRSYIISFSEGNTKLEIMSRPEVEGDNSQVFHSGYIHISFAVGTKEAVDNLTSRLEADGYNIFSNPRTTGDGFYESCIIGPEGILIEITQ